MMFCISVLECPKATRTDFTIDEDTHEELKNDELQKFCSMLKHCDGFSALYEPYERVFRPFLPKHVL